MKNKFYQNLEKELLKQPTKIDLGLVDVNLQDIKTLEKLKTDAKKHKSVLDAHIKKLNKQFIKAEKVGKIYDKASEGVRIYEKHLLDLHKKFKLRVSVAEKSLDDGKAMKKKWLHSFNEEADDYQLLEDNYNNALDREVKSLISKYNKNITDFKTNAKNLGVLADVSSVISEANSMVNELKKYKKIDR